MTTEVILTGTGVPHPRPGRAGAGALVRQGQVALQFDAGRSTVVRLMEAGTPPHALSAVLLTHVHSDHVVGLPDLAMTRWIEQQLARTGPLVVAAEGVAARFVRRMLEPYDDDLALRSEHTGATPIEVMLRPFDLSSTPDVVWTSNDGQVRVLAVAVHHEPVPQAVAYRIETPDAIVVISGDTRVCPEVEQLSTGADVLVHELAGRWRCSRSSPGRSSRRSSTTTPTPSSSGRWPLGSPDLGRLPRAIAVRHSSWPRSTPSRDRL